MNQAAITQTITQGFSQLIAQTH